MKRIQKYLVEFFGFSNEESKGFIIFAFLILLLFGVSKIAPSFFFRNGFQKNEDNVAISVFLKSVTPEKAKSKNTEANLSQIETSDPNTMSFLDWTQIGLDKYLADRIISYRLKGGHFKNPEDLKKIYGLNDSIYSEVSKYLLVSKENDQTSFSKTKSFQKRNYDNIRKFKDYAPKTPKIIPNINFCDSSELLFIKGIGPARAARIIKYRMKLGGFSNKNQLSEVYGLDSLVLTNLKSNTLIIKDSGIVKININTVTFKDLIKHPYVNYNTCKVILSYRKQHGPFNGINDLEKIKIIDADFKQKIAPYLIFQ